jgi:hypothetical protein
MAQCLTKNRDNFIFKGHANVICPPSSKLIFQIKEFPTKILYSFSLSILATSSARPPTFHRPNNTGAEPG